MLRGLPSQVKGEGLKIPSRRGSRVRIPSPAPFLKATRANTIDRAKAITALVDMVEGEIAVEDKASDSLKNFGKGKI